MSVLTTPCRRFFGMAVSVGLAIGVIGTLPAAAQTEVIRISLDQAYTLRLPDRVATIVIGNPLIADATVPELEAFLL